MDIYHVWCDLKAGLDDVKFAEDVAAYLGELRAQGRIAGYRITRRKLGLGPSELGDFHIAIEVEGLEQLDRAFGAVSARSDPLESLHAAVNQSVQNLRFALYRDFPDPQRERGRERF
jgi:hypothetical protein